MLVLKFASDSTRDARHAYLHLITEKKPNSSSSLRMDQYVALLHQESTRSPSR